MKYFKKIEVVVSLYTNIRFLSRCYEPNVCRVRLATVRTYSDLLLYNIMRKAPNSGWLYILSVNRECEAGSA